MSDAVDTSNKFMVGIGEEDVVFMKPLPPRIPKSDALNLAAYIVALADPDTGNEDGEFDKLLTAILNT